MPSLSIREAVKLAACTSGDQILSIRLPREGLASCNERVGIAYFTLVLQYLWTHPKDVKFRFQGAQIRFPHIRK